MILNTSHKLYKIGIILFTFGLGRLEGDVNFVFFYGVNGKTYYISTWGIIADKVMVVRS